MTEGVAPDEISRLFTWPSLFTGGSPSCSLESRDGRLTRSITLDMQALPISSFFLSASSSVGES